MPTPLSALGENAVLQRLLPLLPVNDALFIGPGDDCAVVLRDAEWDSLLKTDAVVEGVHFTPDTPPQLIGRKALARALSDIAAMGGIPEHALITLAVSPQRSVELLLGIYEGISSLAARFGVSVAGGETTSLPCDGLVISVALTGRVERGRAFLRSAARPGDILCVSGLLGGSFGSGRHLTFEPRVELARALQDEAVRPTAAMDLSDGLATDLPRLAAACKCGFDLNEELIPCHAGCCVSDALNDGEDYELLLALPDSPAAHELCARRELYPIGRLTSRRGTSLSGGWQHFAS